MKKIFAMMATAVFMSLVLSACGGTGSQSVPANNASNNSGVKESFETETPEYVVKIDDSFETGVVTETARETLAPEEADFRNLKWGMTRDEVIYTEGTGYREPQENVLYYTRVREEEFPADAEYTFEDGKLVQATFYITENKDAQPVEIVNFGDIVKSLTARFGEPSRIELAFANEEERTEDVSLHKDLILKNKLQYRTGWFLDDTELRVVLFTRNADLCIGLQYKKVA